MYEDRVEFNRTIQTACLGGLESFGGSHAGGSFKSGILEASLGERLSSGPSSMIMICRPFVVVVVACGAAALNGRGREMQGSQVDLSFPSRHFGQ
jgi:hypothetical protein